MRQFPYVHPGYVFCQLVRGQDDILKVPCLPMQISRPLSLPPSARDNLYHGLPVTVKLALRSRLQTYNTEEEVSAQMFHFLST
jgi:hypothetical protein